MSSFVADPTGGALSSNHASPPGTYNVTPPNTLNQESLSDNSPDEAFVSGLQPSFNDGETIGGNDPSYIKAYSADIKAELGANHGISSPILS